MKLRQRILRYLAPELFSGAAQPHENKSLTDGPAIEQARQEGLLQVGPVRMAAGIDGERVVLEVGPHMVWMEVDGADSLAHMLVQATAHIRHAKHQSIPMDQGDKDDNALDIHGYSFLVHTSKGLYRFDKRLERAYLNPGKDVAFAAVQFTITPEGEIVAGEGWEKSGP